MAFFRAESARGPRSEPLLGGLEEREVLHCKRKGSLVVFDIADSHMANNAVICLERKPRQLAGLSTRGAISPKTS